MKEETQEKDRLIEELEAIFNLSLDLIGSGNLDGYFTKINASFTQILGYSEQEFLGEPFTSFVHDEDRAQTEAALEGAAQGKEHIFIENRYRCKNGQYKWIDWKVMAIAHQNKFFAVGRDITARKRAEEELIANELKYRTLFESNVFIIYITDINGTILLANDRAARFMEKTPETIIGTSFFDLRPDRAKMYQNVIDTVVANGETLQFETLYPAKDEDKWLFVTVSPFSVKEDLRLQIITQEITDRKKAEQANEALQKKLSKAQKMETIGLLAGGVAHDLNNILSGIVSYPELLLLDLPRDSKLRKPLQLIKDSGNRAKAVVDDMLILTRGSARNKEVLNLNSVIDSLLESPEYQIFKEQYPDVCVSTNLEGDLANIEGSFVHITKAMMNLIFNALEATKHSANGYVTVSTANALVSKTTKEKGRIPPGEYASVTVLDNGEGIEEDDIEKIFEPFFTKKVLGRSGTGLGLSIVWNTIEDHDGFITVSSDTNGTSFQISLLSKTAQSSSEASYGC